MKKLSIKIGDLFNTSYNSARFPNEYLERCNYAIAFYIYSLLVKNYIDVMDFLFTDYKEGITITIDELFGCNYIKLRNYMRIIEDRKDLLRYHGFILSGNGLSLWDDHDFLNEDWKHKRHLFLQEYEEVKKKAGDRRLDDRVIHFENLVKEIYEDLIRHEFKIKIRDSVTVTDGNYKLKYEKQLLNLITPNGNVVKIAKLQFGRSPDALLTYLFNNPLKAVSKKTLEKETNFDYPDLYRVLSDMKIDKNLRKTFFDISKNRIEFYPKVRIEELKTKGINKAELDNEIRIKQYS